MGSGGTGAGGAGADDTADYVAITRLQREYGDAVTRRAWHELDAMFVPGCPVRLDLRGTVVERVGAQELADFVAASLERFELFVFTVQNTVVDLGPSGDVATGRLYIQELRQEAGTHRWSTAHGLYQDAYRKVDGRWRFAHRAYSTLARTSADGDGMDVFPIPPR